MPVPAGSTVAIYVKPGHPQAQRMVAELATWLQARGLRPLPDAPAGTAPALAVVLGGDGTMLHVAPRLAASGTPILAVHLGTLGFLTEIALPQMYSALELALAGTAVGQPRAMLAARLEPADGAAAEFLALNEIVLGKGELARMVRIDVTVNGEPLARYRADGVLVGTPTGSTAYNFSAGGAVVHPAVPALLITPICPHALNQRPLVVPASSEIVLALAPDSAPAFVTLDGQHGHALHPGDRLLCRNSPYVLTLLTPAPASFFGSLRAKLNWA